MTEVSMEELLAQLQTSPEGRIQLELAMQRAIIEKQNQEINRLLEGTNSEEVQ